MSQPISLSNLRRAFASQKACAKRRRIGFELTFDEWLAMWESSGKLKQRGCKKGQYVMARFGDKGDYEIGNVKIILHSENTKERWALKGNETALKIKEKQIWNFSRDTPSIRAQKKRCAEMGKAWKAKVALARFKSTEPC